MILGIVLVLAIVLVSEKEKRKSIIIRLSTVKGILGRLWQALYLFPLPGSRALQMPHPSVSSTKKGTAQAVPLIAYFLMAYSTGELAGSSRSSGWASSSLTRATVPE